MQPFPKLDTANFISRATKLNDKVGLEFMVVSTGKPDRSNSGINQGGNCCKASACGIKTLLLTARLPGVEPQLHPSRSVSYASAMLLGPSLSEPAAKKISIFKIYVSTRGSMSHYLTYFFLTL